MDYGDPDGAGIDLMISRLASTDPDRRRGTLMLNPGGPGGSGLSQPAFLVSMGLPASVLDTYDLIGMDTRGIGRSSPLACGLTPDGPYFANVPPYAVDDAAVLSQAKIAKKVAAQCESKDTKGLLPHVTTANAARDLDRIREALGEERTSYLGYSYGTSLGAAYASMFPNAPTGSSSTASSATPTSIRRGCAATRSGWSRRSRLRPVGRCRHESYGLGRTPAQVRRSYLDLAARLDEKPVAGVNGVQFRQLVFAFLYKETRYPQLAQQWQALENGDAAGVRAAAPPEPSAADTPAGLDNSLSVFMAVTCNDVDWPEKVGVYRKAVAEHRERYPLFGAAAANINPCAFWPYAPAEPPVAIDDDGPRNILLVQNVHDVPTPYVGAKALRKKFADRSRLLSVADSGHGSYVLGDNACGLNTTTRYLVEGELPRKDTFCR